MASRPLCHTQLNASDVSRQTACVVTPLSKMCTGHYSWLTVESPRMNPDCDWVIILLYRRKLYICLWMHLSSNLSTPPKQWYGAIVITKLLGPFLVQRSYVSYFPNSKKLVSVKRSVEQFNHGFSINSSRCNEKRIMNLTGSGCLTFDYVLNSIAYAGSSETSWDKSLVNMSTNKDGDNWFLDLKEVKMRKDKKSEWFRNNNLWPTATAFMW